METDYWNALDQRKIAENAGIDPKYIGMGSHAFKDQLAELKAKSFMGASRFELAFAGKGAGIRTRGQTTPGSIGKTEREMTREMAKLNEVELSTHACINIAGFSGLTDRGFSDEEKAKNIGEIKRAVDFAADVAQGGPVVIHTGEFPRPIYRPEEKFRAYEEEEKRRIHYLVDKRTGDLIKQVKENEVIFEPVPMRDEKKRIIPQKNPDGTIKKDKYGNPIPEYQLDEHGNINVGPLTFSEFKEKLPENQKKDVALLFFEKQQLAEKEHHAGQAEQYEMSYKNGIETKRQLEKDYEDYKKTPVKDKWRAAHRFGIKASIGEDTDPMVDKLFKEKIREAEKTMAYGREIAVSARKQAEIAQERIDRAAPLETEGVKRSAKAIADLGMYAFEREKKRGLKKPLFIAPENFMPETYGAHPQELRNIILKSREEMSKKLKIEGYSISEAKNIAKEHIKATFDTGHAYLWKKYFKGPKKDFDSWLKNQISQLTKEGIIGHVHLTDNFGYYDEHLAPGEGSIPIKEFVDEIKKQGYKGPFIIEAGYEEGKEHEALTGAFRTLQSPIYRTDALSQTWSDIQTSYFARTSGTPGYLVGDYAPSKDWTLWSEVPLE